MNILAVTFALFTLVSSLYALSKWGLLAGLIVGIPMVGALWAILGIGG